MRLTFLPPVMVAGLATMLVGISPAQDTRPVVLEVAPQPRQAGAPAAEAAKSPALERDQTIITEIAKNSEIMKNLEYLCDRIGPRMTGSANLVRANKWAAEKMKEYGLENVTLEPWEIPVAWERGPASMKLLTPNTGKSFTFASMAWTPGTKGKVTGPVVAIDIRTKDDLAKYKGKLKGAIVLRGAPAVVAPVTDLTYGPGAPAPKKENDPKAKTPPPQPRPSFAEMRALRLLIGEFLRSEGVVALVADAAKPHGLLMMTGAWQEGDRGDQNEPLPTLFMVHEHYSMLYRLASKGETPTVELNVENKFIPGPVTVYNTVGEIRGAKKPDEFVVVGAHLDSWDLGSGATDNGTGSTVILEVARTLGKLAKQGIRPDRTIRFALFSGEEQGLHGSKQYVKRHEDELSKISMALVHDTGTGKVLGFGLQGRPAVQEVLEPELVSLKTLDGWQGLSLRSSGGTDHLSFEAKNIPGFACQQEIDEYRLTHHTQTDTFDHVKEPNLIQGAQVIAVAAFRVANMPNMLPRNKPEPKKEPKKKDEPKKESN
jgi:hypothetical protein